jgi:hypothetical protein
MSVHIERGTTWRAGNPVKVLEGQYYNGLTSRSYDVSPDGKRFLMIKTAGATASDQAPAVLNFVVVQHWDQELKRLVPTR